MSPHMPMPHREASPDSMILSHNLCVFGLTEPQVRSRLEGLMDDTANPSMTLCEKTGEITLRLTAEADTAEDCEELMAPLFWDTRSRLGEYLYGVDVDSLEARVAQLLKDRHLTFSAAESCTGGLIAKRITDISGASAVFMGGVVSYTNSVKAQVLGVPQELLDGYGAVSEPVAKAMAEGVRRLTRSDLAVSVTGVAGPDKDDRGNEVGTVFVGITDGHKTHVRKLDLGTGRDRVRTMAAHYAFDMLRRYITDLPMEGE
ncbi:MAG: nicotinamide-nucleotide amidohydrolase family protein [Eubacteriales bacterium]|nr:nicotinamide-nucleotide amidohydrolase family protein [Eubacteriales bacterium]